MLLTDFTLSNARQLFYSLLVSGEPPGSERINHLGDTNLSPFIPVPLLNENFIIALLSFFLTFEVYVTQKFFICFWLAWQV